MVSSAQLDYNEGRWVARATRELTVCRQHAPDLGVECSLDRLLDDPVRAHIVHHPAHEMARERGREEIGRREGVDGVAKCRVSDAGES